MYLREIGRGQLLTAEDERYLACRLEEEAALRKLTRRLHEAFWNALGGSGANGPAVQFDGGGALPAPFAVSHLGAASFATAAAAIAELVSTVSPAPPATRVNRALAAAWLVTWSAPVGGWDRGTPWHGVSSDYATADGRWIRLQANYPHLRQAVLDEVVVVHPHGRLHDLVLARHDGGVGHVLAHTRSPVPIWSSSGTVAPKLWP